ncbi:hypothetical protein [Desulfolucanica intricata]|uniref:hypothetical protein n=1 Tax=Desulfolucanica intricata TaxID=1285191 RepID=UPI00083265AE|nr:hypothetical protein [Desulfolucanica intricata]
MVRHAMFLLNHCKRRRAVFLGPLSFASFVSRATTREVTRKLDRCANGALVFRFQHYLHGGLTCMTCEH